MDTGEEGDEAINEVRVVVEVGVDGAAKEDSTVWVVVEV